jgi:hypothetical protein
MKRKLKASVIAAFCLLGAAGSACGSQASQARLSDGGPRPCVIKHRGVNLRILPETSGLPCSSIRSILKILPGDPGVFPLENENGERSWVCRVYGTAALPREVRCHKAGRYFEIVRSSG